MHAKILTSFVLLASLAVVGSMTLSNQQSVQAASSPIVNAQAGWPRSMSLVYCWGTIDPDDISQYCPCAELTLHKRPRDVDVFDCATGIFYPAAGTWSKTRRWRQVTFDFGQVTYTGTRLPDGSYEGMMLTQSGMYGVWRGEFLP